MLAMQIRARNRRYRESLAACMGLGLHRGSKKLDVWIPGLFHILAQRDSESTPRTGPLGTSGSAVSSKPPSSHAEWMQKRIFGARAGMRREMARATARMGGKRKGGGKDSVTSRRVTFSISTPSLTTRFKSSIPPPPPQFRAPPPIGKQVSGAHIFGRRWQLGFILFLV